MAIRTIPISTYYYKKTEIDAYLNAKVNTSDIKDNLTSTDTDKPLSAKQGKQLKDLVDSKSASDHDHGSINNNGTLTDTASSVNKVMVTDSNDAIKSIGVLPASSVTHQDISGKVNISDIEDNLTSTDTDKPLSANQGKELKALIDTKANSNDVYAKTDTMSTTEITQAIAASIGNIDIFEVVTQLPTSNIKKNKFYLVPNGENINGNVYDINIYVNNQWETIDSLEFDISNYPTTSEVAILLDGKVDKINGKGLSENDFTNALKSKLENDVLTEHQSLANYIQKSQTSGLVKNDGTIDTNNYLTKEEAPKLPNYGFIDSNLILHLIYVGTEISATKTIMQNGDNNPITVIVSDEDGNPLEDMPVEFYIDGTKVGQTINTDSNGVASYTYQGNGSGEIEVQVKIGSFVSETYNVLDCDFYDSGVTGTPNSEWWVMGGIQLISDDTGLTATTVGSGTYYISPNKKGTSKNQLADLVDWNEFICEFTYISHSGSVLWNLRDTNSNAIQSSFNNLNLTNGDIITIKYTNNTCTAYKNHNPNSTIRFTGSASGDVMIRFSIPQNANIKFKEFKVYPI